MREASARRARRSARSRAPGSCLPVAQSNRLKYLAPLNVRMSLSFGSRRRALQRPAASSMSDADSRARVLTTTPPRRLRSARATSRPPPPPHATPPGASRSPFSDTPRVCGSVRSRFRLSFSGKTKLKKRFSPPRLFAGPRRPCRTSCLTRQTNPRVLTRPQNTNTQKQPRLGSVRARRRRRRAVGLRTDCVARVRADRRADWGPGVPSHPA